MRIIHVTVGTSNGTRECDKETKFRTGENTLLRQFDMYKLLIGFKFNIKLKQIFYKSYFSQ